MTPSLRILVVDDDFATLEFLRSILALAQDDFDVLGVPWAEEALLELKQSPYRLLIADVRLPGMSGIDLVRAAWEIRPELPVIMITAYTMAEVGQELRELGVTTTFRKPLDAEDFLEAVFAAVEAPEPAEIQPDPPVQQNLTLPSAVAERLDLLRTDTGARQVVMATTAGELLYVSGSQPDFDLREALGAMTESVNTGFRLAHELDQDKPLIIQFLSGETCDVYFTNIDRAYFTAIFIDTQARRGRIGTIWVFTQRAVRDIGRILIDVPEKTPGQQDQALAGEGPGPGRVAEAVRPSGEDSGAGENMTGLSLTVPGVPADVDKESVVEDVPPVTLENDQLESLLAEIAEDEELTGQQGTSTDAFWEEALGAETENATPGLSLDEAREQGLIGPEFDIDES